MMLNNHTTTTRRFILFVIGLFLFVGIQQQWSQNRTGRWVKKRTRLQEDFDMDFAVPPVISANGKVMAWSSLKSQKDNHWQPGQWSIQVYNYDHATNTMTPKGSRLHSEDDGGMFLATSLSANGQVMMVLHYVYSYEIINWAQVLEWRSNDTENETNDWTVTWDSRTDLNEQRNAHNAVLSQDGNHMILTFGYKIQWSKSHTLQAYRRNGNNHQWTAYGQPLDKHFVDSMELSTEGDILAIGTTSLAAINNDHPEKDPSSMRAYVLLSNNTWQEYAQPLESVDRMDSVVSISCHGNNDTFYMVAGGLYRRGGALQVLQGSTLRNNNDDMAWKTVFDQQVKPWSANWMVETSQSAVDGRNVAFITTESNGYWHVSRLYALNLETNKIQQLQTIRGLFQFQTDVSLANYNDGTTLLFVTMESDRTKTPSYWVEVWEKQ